MVLPIGILKEDQIKAKIFCYRVCYIQSWKCIIVMCCYLCLKQKLFLDTSSRCRFDWWVGSLVLCKPSFSHCGIQMPVTGGAFVLQVRKDSQLFMLTISGGVSKNPPGQNRSLTHSFHDWWFQRYSSNPNRCARMNHNLSSLWTRLYQCLHA